MDRWLYNLEDKKIEYLGYGNVFKEFLESGKKKACNLNLTKLGKIGSVQNM